MEFLTGLWSKLNKPIHFLLVGVAISFVSPAEYRWVGYLFVAFGLAGTIEWLWKHAIHFKEELERLRAMRRIISYLNTDEKRVLQAQVEKKEQTFYLNWDDYHGIYANDDDRNEYRRLAGIYRGLAEKGIIQLTAEDTSANFHFIDPAWKMLLQEYSRNPEFLSVPPPDTSK